MWVLRNPRTLRFVRIVRSKSGPRSFTCARGTGGRLWYCRGRNRSNPPDTWCTAEATAKNPPPSVPLYGKRRSQAVTHLSAQQKVGHDIMRASRVLRERGMSHRLILNQRRVLVSKKLDDILGVLQWRDGVDLSCGTGRSAHR